MCLPSLVSINKINEQWFYHSCWMGMGSNTVTHFSHQTKCNTDESVCVHACALCVFVRACVHGWCIVFECSTCLEVFDDKKCTSSIMMKNTLGMSLIKSKLKIDVTLRYIFRMARDAIIKHSFTEIGSIMRNRWFSGHREFIVQQFSKRFINFKNIKLGRNGVTESKRKTEKVYFLTHFKCSLENYSGCFPLHSKKKFFFWRKSLICLQRC